MIVCAHNYVTQRTVSDHTHVPLKRSYESRRTTLAAFIFRSTVRTNIRLETYFSYSPVIPYFNVKKDETSLYSLSVSHGNVHKSGHARQSNNLD